MNKKLKRVNSGETVAATIEDIAEILEVQHENLLANKTGKTEEEKSKGGFLIYPVSKNEFIKAILKPDVHLLLVTKEYGRIKGYLLCYDFIEWKKIKPTWNGSFEVTDKVRKVLNEEKVLYMRHIARIHDAEGAGETLLTRAFSEASNMGYTYAIAEILKEPIENMTSVQFAKKFGMSEVGTVRDGELLWVLFMKKLCK